MYLFMRGTERGRDIGRRDKQAPCGEPDVGLNPRTLRSHPGPKAGTQPLSHPDIPVIYHSFPHFHPSLWLLLLLLLLHQNALYWVGVSFSRLLGMLAWQAQNCFFFHSIVFFWKKPLQTEMARNLCPTSRGGPQCRTDWYRIMKSWTLVLRWDQFCGVIHAVQLPMRSGWSSTPAGPPYWFLLLSLSALFNSFWALGALSQKSPA